MRSHGFPNFPDPTFQDNTVTFNTPTPIDTNSPQYKSALATCQKLIPAGLPYSAVPALRDISRYAVVPHPAWRITSLTGHSRNQPRRPAGRPFVVVVAAST